MYVSYWSWHNLYKGWHNPYMCCSGMCDHQKLATQSGRAPPKYAEQVRPQSMFAPCTLWIHSLLSNPFWSTTVALVPHLSPLIRCDWMRRAWAHSRGTKGRNLGCFAEIDPRIDSHSWPASLQCELGNAGQQSVISEQSLFIDSHNTVHALDGHDELCLKH